MEIINYKGRRVYTYSNVPTERKDLKSSQEGVGLIEEAYFFELDGDRQVHKIGFDRTKIAQGKSGLMVQVEEDGATACVSIGGLDRVVSFMIDFSCMGNLSNLQLKPVRTYKKTPMLLGISTI